VIETFKEELKKDMDSKDDSKEKKKGWDLLMKADFMSTRQFFKS